MKFDQKKIRAMLIDLDDTLYDYSPCNETGINAACTFLATRLTLHIDSVRTNFDEARKKVKDRLLKKIGHETAETHSRLLYFQTLIHDLTGKSHPIMSEETERVFWKEYFSRMTLLPGAREFLEIIKAQGKRVAIVTDMIHSIQLQKLRLLHIDHLIDIVVSSEEVGREKPHPASIVRALQKLHYKANEAVFIGESEAKDAAAALAAGVMPILVRKRPKNSNLLFFENFKDLMKLFA